jgi:hypothetical protein
MRMLATATIFSGALLLTGGMALAQTSSTTGTTSRTGSTMSTSPGTPSSMGSHNGSGTMSGSPTSTRHVITSEADVRQQLQSEGYSDITNVTREGDHYTANAIRNGSQSVKLRVDANNGMVSRDRG